MEAQLWEASKAGNTELLEKTIRRCQDEGVDINAGNPSRLGSTALHYAAWNGMSASIEILVAAKADVNIQDSWGRRPLHFASHQGHAWAADRLIVSRADVNARQQMGCTPLHYAAREGHTGT
mmetsp:Transcript_79208/g.212486  ORF Transcript_79208/g.212486 Transcript_79208/m.212486 type:complete len:122 (+) Transcript_79208:37-402(+)